MNNLMKTWLIGMLILCSVAPRIIGAAEENPNPTITIHGTLFIVNNVKEYEPGAVVLSTADRTYYHLVGKLEADLKQKAVSLGKKEVWLTGKNNGPDVFEKSIKSQFNEKGEFVSRYKEVLQYFNFRVDSIGTIGQETDIVPPGPIIGPVTREDELGMPPEMIPLPIVMQLQGEITAVNLKKTIPTFVMLARNRPQGKESYTIVITDRTKIHLATRDRKGSLSDMEVTPTALQVGDPIDAWVENKSNIFEANFISIKRAR